MIEQQPLVSIVIPCYNHAQFVQETIQSVIDQDYENIELIIIDDGSKDKSVQEIQKMVPACEARFKRFEFRHRSNKGLCSTLNEALEWCEGKYFSPIASDDIMLPYKTSTQVNVFLNENSKVAGVFGRVTLIKKDYKYEYKENLLKKENRQKLFVFDDIFLRRSKLPAPTAILDISKLREAGGYNPQIKIEDFYLWLKLTEKGDSLVFVDDVFTLYRRHSDNLSKKPDLMIFSVKEILSKYSTHKDYREALARSYMVHAGDLAENSQKGSAVYFSKALRMHFQLLFSKAIVVYFYRFLRGISSSVS